MADAIVIATLPLNEFERPEIAQLPGLSASMQTTGHFHVGAFSHVGMVGIRISISVKIRACANLLAFGEQQRKNDFTRAMSINPHLAIQPLNGADECVVGVPFA